MLSREQVREKMRGPIVEEPVPEWGEGATVGIRRYSARDLIELRELTRGIKDEGDAVDDEANADRNHNIMCEVLSRGLCDGSGAKMFTPADLQEWDGEQRSLMVRLMIVVQKHNGMCDDEIEELSKNSESGPTSDSI